MLRIFFTVLLFLHSGCKNYEEIVSELTLHQANTILLALQQNNIEAKKIVTKELKHSSFAIAVAKENISSSLKILLENNLPKQSVISLKDLYASSNNIIPSKTEEEAKFILAMQGEVENLLKILPHVLDAKVVISTESINDFSHSSKKNKASVIIITNCLENDCLNINEVQNIVSSSIANLIVSDVNVTIKQSQPINFAVNNFIDIPINKNSNKYFIQILLIICFLSISFTAFLIYKSYKPLVKFKKLYSKN